MRIEVRRSGGFAGMTRTFAVDTAQLPRERAERIERLAREAPAARRAPRADAFSYEVTIDGKTREVDDAEALIDELRR